MIFASSAKFSLVFTLFTRPQAEFYCLSTSRLTIRADMLPKCFIEADLLATDLGLDMLHMIKYRGWFATPGSLNHHINQPWSSVIMIPSQCDAWCSHMIWLHFIEGEDWFWAPMIPFWIRDTKYHPKSHTILNSVLISSFTTTTTHCLSWIRMFCAIVNARMKP